MMNRIRLLLPMCLLLASFAAAQSVKDSVITINGGKDAVFMKAPTHVSSPDKFDPARLVTIYSNLGTGNEVYSAGAGVGVLGKNAGQPHPQWSAFGFTPTADHTVNAIRVGVSYVSGTNEVVMSLNENNGGLPGKVLHTWTFTGLPTFGTCCVLQTAKTKQGIAVKKGTMYWVVLRTSVDDTFDVWNNDFGGQQGPYSNNTGNGWQDGGIQQLGAFGVFGK